MVRVLGEEPFPHVTIDDCRQLSGGESSSPSLVALTATNRSKLSSTRIRTASERDSIDCSRWAMPWRRSWYDASGCWTERNAFGSNVLDASDVAAPAVSFYRPPMLRPSSLHQAQRKVQSTYSQAHQSLPFAQLRWVDAFSRFPLTRLQVNFARPVVLVFSHARIAIFAPAHALPCGPGEVAAEPRHDNYPRREQALGETYMLSLPRRPSGSISSPDPPSSVARGPWPWSTSSHTEGFVVPRLYALRTEVLGVPAACALTCCLVEGVTHRGRSVDRGFSVTDEC